MPLLDAFFALVFTIFVLAEGVSMYQSWRERHDERVRWEARVDRLLGDDD